MTSWEIKRLADRLGMPEPSAVSIALVRAAVLAERQRALAPSQRKKAPTEAGANDHQEETHES